jgi:RNA polymerase sigma-70 factor (ECF subfamily)
VNHPDADCVENVQKLFLENQAGLYGYVLSIVRDFSLAQDIVQDTFLIVTRKAAQFDPNTNFVAWVYTIARYEALASMRRLARPALAEETLQLLFAQQEPGPPEHIIAIVRSCMQKLTPNVQRMLSLRYEDALKPAEIARLLGWTSNAVSVAICRARLELRKCVKWSEQTEDPYIPSPI